MQKVLYLLGQLNDEDLEWLLHAGNKRSFPAGKTLIQEGVNNDHLYIVLQGEMAVSVQGSEVARLGAGEIVGEMSFVDDRPPSASVQTVSETLFLAIPHEVLRQKLEEDVYFAAHFYKAIAIFVSYRLRDLEMGPSEVDTDRLDSNLLDNLYLAGTRFERMLKVMVDG